MSKLKVLYIAYWGAAEPLGQSLILPAVKKLAALGVDLTLVTFEKASDLDHGEEISLIRESLDDCGVRWIPLRYHKQPKIPATAYDIAHGYARAIMSRLRTRFDIVHARTFVGGLMGLMIAPILRAKLVYHNEGFYPDEQVDGGVWALNSTPHRVAKSLERRIYSRADAIIALSHRAKIEIEALPAVARKATPVIVVPSCVDLNHFKWNSSKPAPSREEIRFVYLGSVGGRYNLDKIARFVAIASRELGRARLHVITTSEPGLVASILEASGLPRDSWSSSRVAHQAMPDELIRHHVGLHFLSQGLSDHGGSPTKIGEYWAAGLPVIATPKISDTDEIIRRELVGVVVSEHSDDAYRKAVAELQSILADHDTPLRCRRAAETHYALGPACERQMGLYRDLISLTARRPAGAPTSKLSNS